MQPWYPTTMPSPRRLPDGGIVADGTYIPFGASCAPGSSPDAATRTCVPSPGALNVNYECGGILAPLGTPGCAAIPARAAAQLASDAVAATGITPRWPLCACNEKTNTRGPAVGKQSSAAPDSSLIVCFAFAAAILAAVLGGRNA